MIALPFGAVLLTLAVPAQAEPTVAPLANEPIIRTLEAGEQRPVANAPTATVTPSAHVPGPAAGSVSAEQTEPREISNRVLGLYGVVVVSLLGVMVLAIILINRRSARRSNSVVSPPAPTFPLAVASQRLSFDADPLFTNSSASSASSASSEPSESSESSEQTPPARPTSLS